MVAGWQAWLGSAVMVLNVAVAGDLGHVPYGTWYEWAHFHDTNVLRCAQATVLTVWPAPPGIEVLRQCRDAQGDMRRSDDMAEGSGDVLSWKVYSIWPFYHRERILSADAHGRFLVVGADGLEDVMVLFPTPEPAPDAVSDALQKLGALGVDLDALARVRRVDTAQHAAHEASSIH